MSRKLRQTKILEIISNNEVETQEELVNQLRHNGFEATQATVSRDIKELGLVKTLAKNGKYKYVTKHKVDVGITGKMLNLVKDTVVGIVTANNLIVVKTLEDSASAVARQLENLAIEGVVGVLADKSTVLVITQDFQKAEFVAESLRRILC